MRLACLTLLLLAVSACKPPPDPDVTREAAGRSVLGGQYDDCVQTLRELRETRNRHHREVGRMRDERNTARAALEAAIGAQVEPARAALAAAELAVTRARERYEQDRAAFGTRRARCDEIDDRLHAIH